MSPVEHFKTFCQKIYRKAGRLHDTKSMGVTRIVGVTEGQRVVRFIDLTIIDSLKSRSIVGLDKRGGRQNERRDGGRMEDMPENSKYDSETEHAAVRQLSNKWRQRGGGGPNGHVGKRQRATVMK